MRINKYLLKQPLIFIALCLLGAIFNVANMTDSRYNARQSILSLSAHNASSQVLDNKTKPLAAFYRNLIEDVAEWKIPRGYKLTEAYFKTETENVDVLAVPEKEPLEVSLSGDKQFVLKVKNEKLNITCDSLTRIKLNSINLWDITNDIHVRIEDKKYFFIALGLSLIFAGLLLFIRRSLGVVFILVCVGVFLGLALAKQFVKPELALVLRYMDVASSVCIMLILVAFYFVQAGLLATYYEMHNMFAYQFKTYVVTAISILLSVFNHNIAVNIVNWFVWVPILQCYVFQNYEEIVHRALKKKMAEDVEIEKMKDEFDHLKIDDAESIHEYSDFHQRRRKNFRPYLMFIHLVLFIASLIVCFKNDLYFKATREVDEAMSKPFDVANMGLLDVKDFVRNKESSSVTFNIVKINKDVEIDDISLITSRGVLKAWVDSFLRNISFKSSLILFKELDGEGEYQLFNDENTGNMEELNIKLLFIFESAENLITTAEISMGENKVSTTLKNLNVITFGLNQNKYLGILIFFNCIVLLLAVFFTGGKDKSKFKLSLILLLLVINIAFGFAFFQMIPKYAKNIRDDISIMRGVPDFDSLKRFLDSVIRLMWMRKGVTVIVFFCIVLIVIYIMVSMPKEYSAVNKNMTGVKRPITSDWKNLRILAYQFAILILTTSIIGHEAFGYKYDEFRNELLSLRYNFIMIFNKFLIEPKADIKNPLYIYHRFAIFVFYNVVLTAFLATFYFHSCTNRDQLLQKNSNFFVFPKPGDFNFDVNIKATFEEILAFKVFLRAFNSYKEHVNVTQHEKDSCSIFMDTFTQNRHGLNELTFNGDLYVYFERIKRYLLCIVFLRMKIGTCNAKIKSMEDHKEGIVRQNENKRDYLILLQKKLRDTIAEVERFRSNNTILELIEAENKREVAKEREKPFTNTIKIKKYDMKQLEAFITNPKSYTVSQVFNSFSQEPEGEVGEVDRVAEEPNEPEASSRLLKPESNSTISSRISDTSGQSIPKPAGGTALNEPGLVGRSSRAEARVGMDEGGRKPEMKEDRSGPEVVKKSGEGDRKGEGDRVKEKDRPPGQGENVGPESGKECSNDKGASEAENKPRPKGTLSRPTRRLGSAEVGIFKSNVLKKLE